MEYKEIQDLIKLVKKNDIAELKISQDDFKIVIRMQGEEPVVQQTAPVQAPVIAAPQVLPQQAAPAQPTVSTQPAAQSLEEENSNYVEIKSPMIGTFYRAAGPDKDPFVSIGDKVSEGQTICMVEAMKLFNEIEAEQSGTIVKILVEDATPVEFDQPLFLIDPKG